MSAVNVRDRPSVVASRPTRAETRPVDEPMRAPQPGDELIVLASTAPRRPSSFLVRAFDVVGATVLLAVTLPLWLIVSVVIFVFDGRPILFRQTRIGRNGQTFEILKFRTMRAGADAGIESILPLGGEATEEFLLHRKLRNDPRVTRLGGVLRRSRLDELPQFWNVLMGDMSLVGPRPVVPGEIRRYGGLAQVAFSVRPGMTGLWQVDSSNSDEYHERVELDVRFATNHSFRQVVTLAAKTPFTMMRSLRRGEFR